MKLPFTFLFILLMYSQAFACTFSPRTFCETASEFSNTVVLRGVFSDSMAQGIRVDVLEVFRGVENRPSITIWNGTDWECNGTFPMRAHLLGNKGDTLVLAIPLIDTLENAWDVLGDYRCTYLWLYTPSMTQKGDTLYGSPHLFPQYKIGIEAFRQTASTCLNQPVSNDPLEEKLSFKVFPNPVSDFFLVEAKHNGPFSLEVYNPLGQAVIRREFHAESLKVEMGQLPPGLYTLVLRAEEGQRAARKLLVTSR